jgi:hypothetical protein
MIVEYIRYKLPDGLNTEFERITLKLSNFLALLLFVMATNLPIAKKNLNVTF